MKIEDELDNIISELESKGISSDIDRVKFQTRGLGNVVESVLNKFGITQERYKQWFNLQECNCTKRKEWLNNFFSWQVRD